MKEIVAHKGRTPGSVSITKSIATMEVGDVWQLDPSVFSASSVRNGCSRVNTTTSMRFKVLAPCFDNAYIRIIRVN